MLRNLLIAALSTVCLIGPARADPPDAYHAHYPRLFLLVQRPARAECRRAVRI